MFWCECNGDKAALTAAAQASANALAQEKANAMECDCPKTWSAVASGSFSNGCLTATVQYDNPCGGTKNVSFDVYYTRTEITGEVEYFLTSKSVVLPTGSGTINVTGQMCHGSASNIYISNPSQSGSC